VDFMETEIGIKRATYYPPGETEIVDLCVTHVGVSTEVHPTRVTIGLNHPGNDEPWGCGVEFDLDADGARAIAQRLMAAAAELTAEREE